MGSLPVADRPTDVYVKCQAIYKSGTMTDVITKLPELDVLCGNMTEFGDGGESPELAG